MQIDFLFGDLYAVPGRVFFEANQSAFGLVVIEGAVKGDGIMLGITSSVFGRPARFVSPWFLASMLILYCYSSPTIHNSTIANEPKGGDVTTKLTLSDVGDVFEIDTGLLIEGVAKELSIDVVNQSGFYFKDLSHRVSCACLRLKNTDGKDMGEGEKLNLTFSLLPTHGGYGQFCVINGVGEDGTRTPICKLVFTGKVIAPVALSRTAAMVSDLANGFSCSLAVENGIRIKYDAISVLGDGATVIASEAESELRFTFGNDTIKAGVYLVSIPFESGGREFKHTIPLRWLTESLKRLHHNFTCDNIRLRGRKGRC